MSEYRFQKGENMPDRENPPKREIRPIGPQMTENLRPADSNLRLADDLKNRKGCQVSPG